MEQTYTWLCTESSQINDFFRFVVFANSPIKLELQGGIQWYNTNNSCKKKRRTDINWSWISLFINQPRGLGKALKAVKPTGPIRMDIPRCPWPDPLFETWGPTVESTFQSCWKLPVLGGKLRQNSGAMKKSWEILHPLVRKKTERMSLWFHNCGGTMIGARLSHWGDECIYQYNILIAHCLQTKTLSQPRTQQFLMLNCMDTTGLLKPIYVYIYTHTYTYLPVCQQGIGICKPRSWSWFPTATSGWGDPNLHAHRPMQKSQRRDGYPFGFHESLNHFMCIKCYIYNYIYILQTSIYLWKIALTKTWQIQTCVYTVCKYKNICQTKSTNTIWQYSTIFNNVSNNTL